MSGKTSPEPACTWRGSRKRIRPGLLHFFIFDDQTAHMKHGESDAVKKFEAVYSPELVGGPVVFTDYELVAANE